jgi:hypothetical protein
MPETQEVYDAVKMTSDILEQRWDGRTYCSIPQWQRLIQTPLSCGAEMEVRVPEDDMDSEWLKLRSLGIVEAQEAMEHGVAIRDEGPTGFLV